MARFELEVDPEGILPPDERARRAEHKRKAYFQRLALKSAKARRARAVVAEGEAAERELRALGEGQARGAPAVVPPEGAAGLQPPGERRDQQHPGHPLPGQPAAEALGGDAA